MGNSSGHTLPAAGKETALRYALMLTGGFMLADGRTVTGDTPEETAKLMRISESPHSGSTKTRMVDVLARLPKTATSDTRDLLQSDLPTELDNDLRRLIEIA